MKREIPSAVQDNGENAEKHKKGFFNASLLVGEITPEIRQNYKKKIFHETAFDYYHPVNNFLYLLQLPYTRFIQMVDEGVKVEADEDLRSLAREFITDWIKLIRKSQLVGHSSIDYDRNRLKEKLFEGTPDETTHAESFKKAVSAVCALAGMDVREVLSAMLLRGPYLNNEGEEDIKELEAMLAKK